MVSDEDGHAVYCGRGELSDVLAALEARFGEPESANIVWKPQSTVDVSGDQAAALLKLLSSLEDSDDVQSVFANFEIAEAEMERLAG